MQRYFSNIYWHFTGSPDVDWHRIERPEEILEKGRPKPDGEAVAVLLDILASGKLLATCTERISDGLSTRPFCCTTDIPFKDLLGQAPYYGRAAIGFKPRAIHRNFVPVLYISRENLPFLDRVRCRPPSDREDGYLLNFVKITDFEAKAAHSFYREREWRHLGDFLFQPEDVSSIVVPNAYIAAVRSALEAYRYPADISVLAWEFVEQA